MSHERADRAESRGGGERKREGRGSQRKRRERGAESRSCMSPQLYATTPASSSSRPSIMHTAIFSVRRLVPTCDSPVSAASPESFVLLTVSQEGTQKPIATYQV